RDSSSPATVVNGMKVVKLSITRLESVNVSGFVLKQVRLTETEEMKSSPSPSLAKVKDEPVDEEYEQALISSTSTASVKDEPIKVQRTLKSCIFLRSVPHLVGPLSLTGRPEDRISVLCDSIWRNAALRQPIIGPHVLLPLQEEPAEGTDGFPEEGLPGAVLLHGLPHHVISFCQRSHEALQLLPKVTLIQHAERIGPNSAVSSSPN
ncbi:hypothetical protein GOODEAATRI_008669, partial [Goodea atripinnis]